MDIGEPVKEVEFEPLQEPAEAPVEAPVREPAPPSKEPVPV